MESFDLSGVRVLIMGLGGHGGGLSSARYCIRQGADVTVTDLQTEEKLESGLAELSGEPVRFVLGEHREDDFRQADIVIKNPAVPRSSRFLKLARRIETDVSLFLSRHRGPIYAVTGTKGKSTTASALHFILTAHGHRTRLGGNITVSPLSFAQELSGNEPVVLELSSFQLGDLALTPAGRSGAIPRFALSIITNLLPDHQDYYADMEAYAADKRVVFERQRPHDWVLLSSDDDYSRSFVPPHPDHCVRVTGEPLETTAPAAATAVSEAAADLVAAAIAGERDGVGWLRVPELRQPMGATRDDFAAGQQVELVPRETTVSGRHLRTNLLFAATAAYLLGVEPQLVRRRTAEFPGIPHRLELVATVRGVRYFNDSAATIPEATAAAVAGFGGRVHLIAGGSDKRLSLESFPVIAREVTSLHLLEGSATERILPMLQAADVSYTGPHGSLDAAVAAASRTARLGDIVLLSPGCASFGMFRNEFDRGNQFRNLVKALQK